MISGDRPLYGGVTLRSGESRASPWNSLLSSIATCSSPPPRTSSQGCASPPPQAEIAGLPPAVGDIAKDLGRTAGAIGVDRRDCRSPRRPERIP
jgi:hypothetical protein